MQNEEPQIMANSCRASLNFDFSFDSYVLKSRKLKSVEVI